MSNRHADEPSRQQDGTWGAVAALRKNGILQTLHDASPMDAARILDGWLFVAMTSLGTFHFIGCDAGGKYMLLVTTRLSDRAQEWWQGLVKRPLEDHSLKWFSEGAGL